MYMYKSARLRDIIEDTRHKEKFSFNVFAAE